MKFIDLASQFRFHLCFEGEGNETPPGDDGNQLPPSGGDGEAKFFTQADVNKFLADDRRKHEARYKQVEQTLQTQLKNAQLGANEREKLQKDLEELQASFRTKEQQAEYEKKQAAQKYERELNETKARAERWETMFRKEKIDRSLLDAAGSDAFNPTLIVDLLRPVTELREETDANGNPTGHLIPMISFNDIDEKTGEPIKTLRTPTDAVKRMKELPSLYGGLFKSNVVSGVGAGSAEGTVRTGKIDPTTLSPEQYRKLRQEDPAKLGLGTRKRY